jgi:gluconokinase
VSARLAIVVMGVSGCGKSTVADGLARRFGLACVDGDELHSAANIAKMSHGVALTDDDRWPWLDRVGNVLADVSASPAGMVVSCSALRQAYRDRVRHACPAVRFVFLDGSAECIAERMARRSGHYMPLSLLRSQLQTLERPALDEPDVLHVDIDAPVEQVIAAAARALGATALPSPRSGPLPSR